MRALTNLVVTLLLAGIPACRAGAQEADLRFVPDGEFGDQEGPGALLLPLDVAQADDGSVFVLEYSTATIVHFAVDGSVLGAAGGPGEGPAEFRRPRNLAALPGGRVVVFDLGARRFSVFDSTLAFVRTVPYQGDVRKLASLPDGAVVGHFRYPEPGWVEEGAVHRIVRFDAELRVVDVLDSARIVSNQVVSSSGDGFTHVPRPFAPEFDFVCLESGSVVTGLTNERVLRLHRQDGDTELLTLPVAPRRIDARVREEYLTRFGGDDPRFRELLEERIEFPEYLPAFPAIVALPGSGFLVQRAGSEDESRFDVFDAGGVHRAAVTATLPEGRTLFRDGLLFCITEPDDDQLPVVKRYRIELAK